MTIQQRLDDIVVTPHSKHKGFVVVLPTNRLLRPLLHLFRCSLCVCSQMIALDHPNHIHPPNFSPDLRHTVAHVCRVHRYVPPLAFVVINH